MTEPDVLVTKTVGVDSAPDGLDSVAASSPPILSVRDAELSYGARPLWSHLDLDLQVGEFVAVLGPNGAGKTSLMRSILGFQPLTQGSISFLGKPVRRGNAAIGYIPQQKLVERGTPIRAQDLVRLGVDGDRWGLSWPRPSVRRRVDAVLESVGATHLATAAMGSLSGGEQQRIRIAQALVSEPRLLLCDEPLSGLDLMHQRAVSELIDGSRHERQLAVLMITHDVNPVLTMVDRVIYLAAGQARVGTVDQVLTTEVLSDLYQTRVEVLRTAGRIVVVGVPEHTHDQCGAGAAPHLGADEAAETGRVAG